ncbi:MAG: nitroreductase family protein [archaeon]|nr:nitroreductase family protein [archaeon]
MDVDKAIKERHSVRVFKKEKKPNYREVISAIDAARKAPLAGNNYALKYILVQDKEIIKQLAEAAQQNFIADVSYILVVCSDKKELNKLYYERGKMYSHQQAGAAIENLMLKLVDLGLSTCWVGAFSDQIVKRVLQIPENIDVEAILPIGYEMGKAKQRTKPDLDDVLFFDLWKNKFMKPRRTVLGSQT